METFLDIDDPLDGELISDTRLDLTELVIESTELACRKELDIREDTRVLIVLRLVLEIRRVGRLGFGSSTRGIGNAPELFSVELHVVRVFSNITECICGFFERFCLRRVCRGIRYSLHCFQVTRRAFPWASPEGL